MPELCTRACVLDGQNAHHVEVHGFQLFGSVVIHQTPTPHLQIGGAIGTNFSDRWVLGVGTFVEVDKVPNGLRALDGFFMGGLVEDDGGPTVVIQAHHGHGFSKFRTAVFDVGVAVPNFGGHTRLAIDGDLALHVVARGDFKGMGLPTKKPCETDP